MNPGISQPLPATYSLLQHLVLFARQLRLAGLPVSPAAVLDLCQAIERIDFTNRADMQAAARATLVHDREHLQAFDAIFDAYWMRAAEQYESTPGITYPDRAPTGTGADSKDESDLLLDSGTASPPPTRGENQDHVAASLIDTIATRDLGELDEHELRLALGHMRELVRKLANRPGRRFHLPRDHGGEVDLRASLRRSARLGFDAIEIRSRKRRIRKLRLLLLCDVSGSMARYSSFLLAFMQALGDELSNLEAAVFGTRMIPVTALLQRHDPAQLLPALGAVVQGWGSGTDIGRAIGEFNQRFAQHIVRSRTVVVILSDGWDRGDPQTMRNAIRALRSWADSLVWLNPLLGQRGYQPLCRGIRTALPYLDHFLTAHDLASLANVVARLRTI